MKNLSTILIALGMMAFFSCQKEEVIEQELYNASLYYKSTVISETDTLSEISDLVNFRIKIKNGQFYKITGIETIGCHGDFLKTSHSISFESQDCSCWCDCSPFLDCGGDFLLGNYEYQKDGKILSLIFSNNYQNNQNESVIFEKIMELERVE